MNISYRCIEKSDQPFLWEMLYQALYVPEGALPFPREIIEVLAIKIYAENWGKNSDEGLVAINVDRPVGAVWIRQMRGYGFVDADTPELTIAVLPEFRGKGIGTDLMSEFFTTLSSRYKAISLSVTTENPAMKLYERLGFEVVKIDGNTAIMIKKLIAHR